MVHGNTVEARRQRKMEEVLDAAMQIVVAQGFDGLTVTALARRLGWTKGAMYRYFAGKDQLIAALNARVLARWDRIASQATAGIDGPLDQVRALGTALCRLSVEEPESFGLIAVTLAEPRQLVAELEDAVHLPAMLQLLGRIAGALQAAADEGSLAPGDPLQRALQLVFGLIGVLQLRKLERFRPDLFDAHALGLAQLDDLLTAWRP